jgi:hypothetical protein
MASCPESDDFPLLVSCNLMKERQRAALRLFVGRGKRLSVKELWMGSGVKEARIEAAMRPVDADDYRPLRHEELASIAKFLNGEGLGAAFLSACIEPTNLGAFELMDGQIPLPKVLATADAPDPAEERKRLIRRLAELEDVL